MRKTNIQKQIERLELWIEYFKDRMESNDLGGQLIISSDLVCSARRLDEMVVKKSLKSK